MSENDSAPAVPDVVVKRKRGVSIIWVIPIVAALIAGWIWWRAEQGRGPTITISFLTAEGIESGKTLIKYKDVEVGKVSHVDFKPDLTGVTITAEMHKGAVPYMRGPTRFWVVRPRIGAGGIEGLGTLLSGAYIAIEPIDSGVPTLEFTGLELPPVAPVDAPGLKLTLEAERLGGVSVGSPIYFMGTWVGEVERHRILKERRLLEIDIYIEPEFKDLVRKNTRFWNAGGIEVSMDADGLEVSMESLSSLLAGGIAFDTPGEPGPQAVHGDPFRLYPDHKASQEVFEEHEEFLLYFRESVRGLVVGAPIEFRGIKVGNVTTFELQFDRSKSEFLIPVTVELQRGRATVLGQRAGSFDEVRQLFNELIKQGLRARLSTGSLLTGALYIELDFHEETEAVLTGLHSESQIELPTIPSTASEIVQTVQQLPLLVADLRATIDSVKDTINGPEVQGSLADVRAVAADLTHISEAIKDGIPQFMDDLTAITDRAEATLAGLQASEGRLSVSANFALKEISGAMRSLRVLADYLERHPESLLKGKNPGGGE